MPLIPLLASLLGITSVSSLFWYFGKSKNERKMLDRQATNMARDLFDKNIHRLNGEQARTIYNRIKRLG